MSPRGDTDWRLWVLCRALGLAEVLLELGMDSAATELTIDACLWYVEASVRVRRAPSSPR